MSATPVRMQYLGLDTGTTPDQTAMSICGVKTDISPLGMMQTTVYVQPLPKELIHAIARKTALLHKG